MVVQLTVARLICSNRQEHVAVARLRVQVVILDSFLRRLLVLPVRQFTLVQRFYHHRVSVDGFFLEIANEPVAVGRRNEVEKEVGVEEQGLGNCDNRAPTHTVNTSIAQALCPP